MTQNLLSRIFGAGSIYETLNDDAESTTGGYSHPAQSAYSQTAQSHFGMSFNPYNAGLKSRAIDENGVPESLLYEGMDDMDDNSSVGPSHSRPVNMRLPPRPEETERWQPSVGAVDAPRHSNVISAKDRANWRWANVNNLDVFLSEVYAYFLGNGIYSILLDRALSLLTLAFVTSFSTYLTACIDYSKIRSSNRLQEIQIDHCIAKMDYTPLIILWLITVAWCIKLFQYLGDIRTLWEIHGFYKHLLDISEIDMQTISWQEVVSRLLAVRDSNPLTSSPNKHSSHSRQRMDAHDIANRIMRKDNYLVAMFNKEILDIRVPLPFFGNQQLMTETMDWNLSMCIFAYFFDEQGQVRSIFVNEPGRQRKALVDGLKRRFLFAGVMNALFAPFIIIYLLLLFFLKYFSEYHKNPSAIGSRQYTPYAQWKFREFNELFHIFQKRLKMSHGVANTYVSQFPNDKTMQLARFASFIAGSFAAVLALVSVIDPDLFLGFEITHDRTVLFYLGLFGTIVAVSRSMVPEETQVFDPAASLMDVIQYTHYSPPEWSGKFHSHHTKAEFCKLYDYKLKIFLQEILSALVSPLILWFSLPSCSEKILDFMKDFTVHVDGVGYVCSFALFDFSKNGNAKYGVVPEAAKPSEVQTQPSERMVSNDGKMEKSFLNFRASNPDWVPDASGSQFLQALHSKAPVKLSNGTASQPAGRPPVFGPRSPYKSSRKAVTGDSYAIHSLRARRGLDASVNMTSTIYQPVSRPSRIAEETDRDYLSESFLDASQKSPSHEQPEKLVSAGVLGLMHQFYQEAGTNGTRI